MAFRKSQFFPVFCLKKKTRKHMYGYCSKCTSMFYFNFCKSFTFLVLMNTDPRSVIRCLEIVIKCCYSVANVFHILRIKSLCYCEILAHYFIFIVIQTKAYPCKSRVTICKNFTGMTSERNASLSKKL